MKFSREILKGTRIHPLFRKYSFGKTTGGGQIDHPSYFRVKEK